MNMTVLSLLSFEFDIIAISETKIIKDIDPNYDIILPGYRWRDHIMHLVHIMCEVQEINYHELN